MTEQSKTWSLTFSRDVQLLLDEVKHVAASMLILVPRKTGNKAMPITYKGVSTIVGDLGQLA